MDEERLREMAGDPRFIAGIYNYCDRWCERCGFTARCLNYAISQEEFAGKDEDEQWQTLGRLMRQTAAMVRKDAEEEGIDLDAAMEEAEADDLIEEKADEQPCCRDAKHYMEAVSAWFDAAKDIFEGQKEEISEALRLELPQVAPEQRAQTLNEATETIRWYQHQIYVKLIRACRGIARSEEPVDYMLDDANGSAKVTLIGIDQSMHAWDTLYRTLGDAQDGILDILVRLERLRKSVEAAFPGARAFVRPGLDELPEEA